MTIRIDDAVQNRSYDMIANDKRFQHAINNGDKDAYKPKPKQANPIFKNSG